ncbi:2OG-Fe(II) oxygenase [Candidatus Nitrosacidococcus tergens]|uniref:Predicted proline hydroxylase n=1 Tax=Candidatus Nitrosacidococcus tergens TaxID=553981 RepID=A0A7G1Q8E9_9GAMM|nr:2OG-Fe(II) oxygenase [Candidatus Nitrosacidococcus tergens]CAB1274992.1 Predicted proline hydroxylase [Candidatus Nitrosacidococcus tergens]
MLLNQDKLINTEVIENPFPHFIVTDLINKNSLLDIYNDYPTIDYPGSYPLAVLQIRERFSALIEELKGSFLEEILEEKFKIPLRNYPLLITVRGKCTLKDGAIHTDSATKIITVLLYLNEHWEKSEGQLRLLRDGENIENYFTQIPPQAGTLLAFKVTKNSWHGHLPFEGARRVVQINWVSSEFIARKALIKHYLSFKLKNLVKIKQ